MRRALPAPTRGAGGRGPGQAPHPNPLPVGEGTGSTSKCEPAHAISRAPVLILSAGVCVACCPACPPGSGLCPTRVGATLAVEGRDTAGRVVADHAVWGTFFLYRRQCAEWRLPKPHLCRASRLTTGVHIRPSLEKWVTATLQRLAAWGFNTAGAGRWSQRSSHCRSWPTWSSDASHFSSGPIPFAHHGRGHAGLGAASGGT